MATKKPNYEAPAPAADKKKALQTALAQIENEIPLPLYSTLTDEDVRFICQTLKDCLQG